MNKALKETNFNFPGQTGFYKGKVRDVYFFEDKLLMIASDRISAFDVILPEAIPYKGQVLNQLAAISLEATKNILPNWVDKIVAPNATYGKRCEPFMVEMVIRGYLAGHAWREYRQGKRVLCGVALPNGLKENDKLPSPIITPSTKATEGHDEDISPEEIIAQGIVSEKDYEELESYTQQLFARGTELADKKGLILVDTKYEFGKYKDQITLIDEIHTPDSSRYFYKDGYVERQSSGNKQKQLSKEFVREWLIGNGFQGKEGQTIPTMTDKVIQDISNRYIELFERMTGSKFEKQDLSNLDKRITENILKIN